MEPQTKKSTAQVTRITPAAKKKSTPTKARSAKSWEKDLIGRAQEMEGTVRGFLKDNALVAVAVAVGAGFLGSLVNARIKDAAKGAAKESA